jgi:truncated hemoglobin YjbI
LIDRFGRLSDFVVSLDKRIVIMSCPGFGGCFVNRNVGVVPSHGDKSSASVTTSSSENRAPVNSGKKKKTDVIDEKDEIPGGGHCTAQGRLDWCKAHGIKDTSTITVSIEADRDPNAPLYYWQLYSVIGMEMIRGIVYDFYKSVFADTEEVWFRDAFIELNDIDQHTRVQTWYWADAMGGGTLYLGGESRIDFHHEHNGGKLLMTGSGARRWMHHMANGIKTGGHLERFNAIDRRIFPCLVDFMRTKMEKYANYFNWAFDPRPFDELETLYAESLVQHPPIAAHTGTAATEGPS